MAMTVAVAGLKGHWGVYLEGVDRLPGAVLVAVAEEDESLREQTKQWDAVTPQTRFYADWREMLERESVEVVCEGCVDSARAEVVVECARRGIHVLAEKPLANSLEELERERAAVEQAGIKLSMMLTMRYEPQYVAVRRAIGQGMIGEVVMATAQKSYRLGDRPAWQQTKRAFSGIIPFIGIHALDLIRWTTGLDFVEVAAHHGNLGHPAYGDMEDHGQVLALLSNGASATVRLDYCRPAKAPTHGDDRLRVAGSEGVIEAGNLLDAERGGPLLLTREDEPRVMLLPQVTEQPLTDFLKWVHGGTVCAVPPEDCFRMTEIVLRAREAARTGRPQKA